MSRPTIKPLAHFTALIALCMAAGTAQAVVLYDEGGQLINGIQLLRDSEDPTAYYYIPTSPRVSVTRDGLPEMFIVKFVDPNSDVAGGLVHFLFTLDLPPEELQDLEKQLQDKVPGAKLRGPVPLLAEKSKDAEQPMPSFTIVSATLTDPTKGSFTKTLVTSGVAPLTPGSKAAVAARLDEHGATLLFDSLEGGPISDISVSLTAYYEAAVRGYRGTVRADISTVYDHMFRVMNMQQGYTKREIRNLTDELVRDGVIEVEVTDRAGLDLDTSAMAGMMTLVTNKLIDMLFDTTQGLSALPEYEKVPDSQVPEHQYRSWINEAFGGNENPAYRTDNQYTLREKSDVRRGVFSLSFTQNTTIKVPFNTSGNIRGLYQAWKPPEGSKDPVAKQNFEHLFRVVNLNDPAFERRPVYFEIDPAYYALFNNTINGVYVTFVKPYGGQQSDYTGEIVFSQNDVKAGNFSKNLTYPRLGITDASWLDYKYRIRWSFRGGQSVEVPADGSFSSMNAPYVSLAPPGDLLDLQIVGDDGAMLAAGMIGAEVKIDYTYLGKPAERTVLIRPGGEEPFKQINLLYDTGKLPRYRIVWHGDKGPDSDLGTDWRPVDSTFLLVTPPQTGT
jgi:hypothetical protein